MQKNNNKINKKLQRKTNDAHLLCCYNSKNKFWMPKVTACDQVGGQCIIKEQNDKEKDRQTDKQRDSRHTNRQRADKQTDRQTQTGRQTDRQTDRHRQTSKQANKQTNKQTGRQEDRQTGRQADIDSQQGAAVWDHTSGGLRQDGSVL